MAICVTIYNYRAHNYFITIVMKFRNYFPSSTDKQCSASSNSFRAMCAVWFVLASDGGAVPRARGARHSRYQLPLYKLMFVPSVGTHQTLALTASCSCSVPPFAWPSCQSVSPRSSSKLLLLLLQWLLKRLPLENN